MDYNVLLDISTSIKKSPLFKDINSVNTKNCYWDMRAYIALRGYAYF